jgi:hypothetical protein
MPKGREKPFGYWKGCEISILDVKTVKNSEKTTDKCPRGAPGRFPRPF